MSGRIFKDRRLHFIVNSIIPFSAESVSDAIGEVWDTKSSYGMDEEIYGLTFLMMLNVVTSHFEKTDRYFTRGEIEIDKSGIHNQLTFLYENISPDSLLCGTGITSSLGIEQADKEIETHMEHLHHESISTIEYEQMQTVQDSLIEGFIRPYLPDYVKEEYEQLPRYIDEALKSRIGITRRDLEAIKLTIIEMEKRYRKTWITPKEDVLSKYSELVLTPESLFKSSLEHLYEFPPFLFQLEGAKYGYRVNEQPFMWISKKELEFLARVRQRHSNVTGDSMELLLKEYLLNQVLVIDETPPISYSEIPKKLPGHFEYVDSNLSLSRNGREDIFSVLRNPHQLELEVDLVADHPDGFSILAEAKYATSYENVKNYYYDGSYDKEPEKDRLLKLADFLNANPERKKEFRIAKENEIIPVFITNAVGPLFSDDDGVVKATPLEVMKVDPFYRLLKSKYDRES